MMRYKTMIKKRVYITGAYALVIGSIIAIGAYIKDTDFGPIAQLVVTVGLIILLLGVLSLWIYYKNKIKYTLVKCANCNKELFIFEPYIRDSMFCTIGCMEKSGFNEHPHFKHT